MTAVIRSVVEFVALRHPYGVTSAEIAGAVPELSRYRLDAQLDTIAADGHIERLAAPHAYLWKVGRRWKVVQP